MKIYLLTGLIVTSLNVFAQKPLHIALKKQLDSILQADQGIREFVDSETSSKRKDSIAQILNYPRELLEQNTWMAMQKIDSINVSKVEQIISKYGYPGKTLVGEPSNTAVFYVIQHSDMISKYYPLIEQASKNNELPFKYAALMLDRKLAEEKKEQTYGSQIYMVNVVDPVTGKKKPFRYVVPILDPENVNKRRKEAGFDTTVEENALKLGVVYKAYTYEEINKML